VTAEARAVSDGYTIGEVLNQLKEDFEDITISKIRFLESEGLVYPDRTESGYRKFSDDDVDRLRFVLTAQRDHYLPLKVIREQLDRLDAGEFPTVGPPATPSAHGAAHGDEGAGAGNAAAAARKPGPRTPDGTIAAQSDVSMGIRELGEATGLDPADIRALRDFGVLGDRSDETASFDADDLAAAEAARELLRLGLEPRHLRMYRQFVEREVSLFDQLVSPLLRQRNPEARRQAARQLEGLAGLTSRLQTSLLTRALRNHLHGS
jgi:DNA-binding transcriptional MerR regulator